MRDSLMQIKNAFKDDVVQCSAIGGVDQGSQMRQVWWVAVETRTNESLVCLLKSLLFSAIESYRRLILAGRCRAHAFPTMESWLPSPVWNNLREARGWSDLAQAQGQAEGGDGNCEADSGGGGVLLCAYLWVSLKAKGKENFARSNLAMRCLRGKREEVFGR